MPYRVSIWAVPLACPRSWQETDHQSGKHEPKEKGSTWRAGEVVAEEHAQTKARNAHAQVSKLQPMQGDPCGQLGCLIAGHRDRNTLDRKSTRLNSSHSSTSYAVFCLKKNLENVSAKNYPAYLLSRALGAKGLWYR